MLLDFNLVTLHAVVTLNIWTQVLSKQCKPRSALPFSHTPSSSQAGLFKFWQIVV